MYWRAALKLRRLTTLRASCLRRLQRLRLRNRCPISLFCPDGRDRLPLRLGEHPDVAEVFAVEALLVTAVLPVGLPGLCRLASQLVLDEAIEQVALLDEFRELDDMGFVH